MQLQIKTLFLILIVFCFPVKAEDSRIENSVLISANEVVYNDNIQVVNAFGEVEIIKDNSIIWADEVTFNQAQNIIIAKGNITYKNEEGDVSYGSSMEFDNDMQTGFIQSPQSRLSDDTQITGALGERESQTITTMKNVVYSPCEVCKGDENPVWQIKAKEVKNDEESLNVTYKNAWLEVYGTPVFYTPYLTHPNPKVKRRSGLLPSSLESSSNVGTMLRNYYYLDIAENTDATFEVTLVDFIKTPLVGAEVRHLFDNGELEVSGSMTMADSVNSLGLITEEDTLQGHFIATGKFDLDEHWRTGFTVNKVSDENYFEFYDFQRKGVDILTSEAYLEGFYGNDYLNISAFGFTDLRPNIPEEQPLILPFAEYSFKGNEFNLMGNDTNWSFEGNFLSLNQDDGVKEFRIYNQSGIEKSYLSNFGMTLDVGADLYTRAYFMDKDGAENSNAILETMPQLYMMTKYPMKKTSANGTSTIIEPMANLIIAPNGANNEDVSLQDSTVLDLDYTNLFSKNRLSGVDRLEDGIRSSYGIKTSMLNSTGGYSSLFLGQTYRERENEYLFPANSGLSDKFSDVIVELQLKPNEYLNLDYYSLIDKDDLTDKKHEAYFSMGKDIFKLMGSYMYSKEESSSNITNETFHELNLGFSSDINDYWKLSGSSTSSLGASGEGLLKAILNLEYIDECFSIGLYGERNMTNRKGAQSDTTVMVRFGLKNLGEISTPALSTDFLMQSDTPEQN